MPTDEGQDSFKEIKVHNLDGERNVAMRLTQEPGVFTVTTDESKTGVATNVQEFSSGAWLEDTVHRIAEVLHQMEGAEQISPISGKQRKPKEKI